MIIELINKLPINRNLNEYRVIEWHKSIYTQIQNDFNYSNDINTHWAVFGRYKSGNRMSWQTQFGGKESLDSVKEFY